MRRDFGATKVIPLAGSYFDWIIFTGILFSYTIIGQRISRFNDDGNSTEYEKKEQCAIK